MLRLIYDRRYNLGLPGFGWVHPFDTRKFARAWRLLRSKLGSRLTQFHVPLPAPATEAQLLLVHSAEYLKSLRQPSVVGKIIEVPPLRHVPGIALDRLILSPMRWQAAGTIVAARECLRHGLAINLGGGFHHAKPSGGEGFSVYNDIALAIHQLRADQQLRPDDRVAYIDLDAHMGNGVAHCFREDSRCFLFDMHNATIYPWIDLVARERIDCLIGLAPQTSGHEYLRILRERLPPFLESIGQRGNVGLAIYNAGSDPFVGDQLGGLALSAEDILQRDLFVIRTIRERGFPTVMVTSGGYSAESYRLIAETVYSAATQLEA